MKKSNVKNKRERTSIGIILFFVIFGVTCIIPFATVITISLSSAQTISDFGYSILPREIYLGGYETIFRNPKTVIDAYKATIIVTIAHTFLNVMVSSMVAFVLARISGSKICTIVTYYIYLPVLFSGGLLANYIVVTKWLSLGDSWWALILPGCVAPFNIFMIRTFIKQQPASLFEAAKIDGAGEITIFRVLAFPLAKPAIATVAFNVALASWNSWYNSMIYIRTSSKITLQHMLQRLLLQMEDIMNQMTGGGGLSVVEIPTEAFRMAMVLVTIGPMMLLFPFFQKYFVKGMVVGAVKG